jgi:nonribosomal peptide synthetase DhbF
MNLVVGMLGILKAGGAYVPLDPEYPADRLAYIAKDTRARVAVCSASAEAAVPSVIGTRILIDGAESNGTEADIDPSATVSPGNLAYVIHTSGSTGEPKGVLVEHRQVIALLEAGRELVSPGPDDRWCLFHSYAFDFSVWEIWGALAFGGAVEIVPPAVSRDPVEFARLLAQSGITVLNQTPSAFGGLMRHLDPERHESHKALRAIVFGGETLPMRTLAGWSFDDVAGCPRLINMYGITEVTVHASFHEVRASDVARDDSVIGTAIPGAGLHILDPQGEPVPTGVTGEIWVSGRGVARGYLNAGELTSERFRNIPDEWQRYAGPASRRMYRSGDLARLDEDGRLVYEGRRDQQLKLRGYRIEPGEIEACLLKIAQVSRAVVVMRDSGTSRARLVAHIICANSISDEQIRHELSRWLPPYMVPAGLVRWPALPTTASGKTDRRQLETVEDEQSAVGERLAVGPLESQLANIWSRLLGIANPDMRTRFMDAGGNSLLAVRLLDEVEAATGRRFGIADLFEYPTIADMAHAVRRRHASSGLRAFLPIRTVGEGAPLICIHGQPLVLEKHLDSATPLYGVHYFAHRDFSPAATVEGIAAQYLEEVRRFQPDGPYRLCGHCFGAMVAHEMAGQLIAAGESVASLVLADPSLPRKDWRVADRLEYLRSLLPLPGAQTGSTSAWLSRIGRSIRVRMSRSLRDLAWRAAAISGRNPDPRLMAGRATDLMVKAWHTYEYSPVSIAATLIFADTARDRADELRDYWQQYFAGGVNLEFVAGAEGHADLMREPGVIEVARIIEADPDRSL